MNIKQKLASAVVLGSMVAAVVAPASFASSVTVTGGGPFSVTKGKVVTVKTTLVSQSNTMVVGTNVNTAANTGGNSSSFNTGGTNSIVTGPATNTVTTTVTGGTNVNTNPCGCADPGSNTLTITGGGPFSYTSGKIVSINESSVSQTNTVVVSTSVNAASNTGGNSSSFNTNGGTTTTTGAAGNTVTTNVTAGGNSN